MQETIVAVIVLLSAWAVARRYLPAPVRRRTVALTAHLLRRIGIDRTARWLERDLPVDASCADGCGSCGHCGPTAAPGGMQSSITVDALKQTIRRS